MNTAFLYKSAFSFSSSKAINLRGSAPNQIQNLQPGMPRFRESAPSDAILRTVFSQIVQSQEEIHTYEQIAKKRSLTHEELQSLAICILSVDRNEQYLKKHAPSMAYD